MRDANSTRWHVVNRSIKIDKVLRYPRSKIIGTKSKNGVVRPLMYKGNKYLLVSKEMSLRKKKSFFREVHVGTRPGIGTVGPRVYAWRKLPNRYEYIMDNLARGYSDAKVTTLHKYTGPKPWRQLYDALLRFYKVSGGFHGDLHSNNIAVITRKGKVSVQIYDYGTWRPFQYKIRSDRIMNYLREIKMQKGNRNIGYAIEPKNDENQLYRKNANVLNSNALKAFAKFNRRGRNNVLNLMSSSSSSNNRSSSS
jgi:hypothetical protein